MSDSRVARILIGKGELAEHEAWVKANAHRLAVYKQAIADQITGSVKVSDSVESYRDASALAVQAHQAGVREGLRSVLSLLT